MLQKIMPGERQTAAITRENILTRQAGISGLWAMRTLETSGIKPISTTEFINTEDDKGLKRVTDRWQFGGGSGELTRTTTYPSLGSDFDDFDATSVIDLFMTGEDGKRTKITVEYHNDNVMSATVWRQSVEDPSRLEVDHLYSTQFVIDAFSFAVEQTISQWTN